MQTMSRTAIAAVMLMHACGQSPTSHVDRVFGEDDRKPTTTPLVGSLEHQGKRVCTAYVSYMQEVTTASHCMWLSKPRSEYAFVLNGQRYVVDRVIEYHQKADVLRLQTAALPTDEYIHEGVIDLTRPVAVTTDTLSDHGLATLHEGAQKILNYTIDTAPGTSGAPILQDGRVVGVHLGTNGVANYGVELDGLSEAALPRDFGGIKLVPEGFAEAVIGISIEGMIMGSLMRDTPQKDEHPDTPEAREEAVRHAEAMRHSDENHACRVEHEHHGRGPTESRFAGHGH